MCVRVGGAAMSRLARLRSGHVMSLLLVSMSLVAAEETGLPADAMSVMELAADGIIPDFLCYACLVCWSLLSRFYHMVVI